MYDSFTGGDNMTRVVVTGLGLVTSLGNDLATSWEALCQGKSGVAEITGYDHSKYRVHFGAQVKDFDPLLYMDKKEVRRNDPYEHIAIATAKQALAQSGLHINDENADDIGVYIGSGIGGLVTLHDQFQVLFEKGPERISPFFINMMIIDGAPGIVSILTGARGPNWAAVSACATSGNTIGEAWETIRRGDATVMIAGGSEKGITPFAMARGATILAELVGYGCTSDAHHVTEPAPGGAGLVKAMQRALKKAGLRPEQVDYINAHGTSTEANDGRETTAIKAVFGKHAYRIPISSTKSMIGHTLGAAGAVEAVISIMSILTGIIAPTINLHHPDPECDLDYVPDRARETTVNVAMSNSMGFSGHNACLIFKRFHE